MARLQDLPSRINIGNNQYTFDISMNPDQYGMTVVINDGERYSTHNVDAYLVKQSHDLPELVTLLIDRHQQILREEPGYVHQGPTNEQLEKYPALRNAWREFLTIKRLCGA